MLRGKDADLTAEIAEMEDERVKNRVSSKNKKIGTMDILKFTRPEWKMALLLGSLVQVGIQLSGFSTVSAF